MPVVNMDAAGFYAAQIGATDKGLPVYLYFDPASKQFRPVVVPPAGNPYYASGQTVIRHQSNPISSLSSAVVLGTLGAFLGGGPGAVIGALAGAALSHLPFNNVADRR